METNAVKLGDLVEWQAGEKTRAGVVKSINPDGTCSVSIADQCGTIYQKIRSFRLKRIVSTVEPEPPRPKERPVPFFKAPVPAFAPKAPAKKTVKKTSAKKKSTAPKKAASKKTAK